MRLLYERSFVKLFVLRMVRWRYVVVLLQFFCFTLFWDKNIIRISGCQLVRNLFDFYSVSNDYVMFVSFGNLVKGEKETKTKKKKNMCPDKDLLRTRADYMIRGASKGLLTVLPPSRRTHRSVSLHVYLLIRSIR